MEFSYRYHGSSEVEGGADRTDMRFAPDVSRPRTFFRGELRQGIAFREAISALHDVVVSDVRFKPKDKTAYKEWLAGHEKEELAAALAEGRAAAGEAKRIRDELATLRRKSTARWSEFSIARQKYMAWLYVTNRDFWYVLDPVITVHPDELSFECFSQDESSYGRLAASYEVFRNVGELACGTTNVDYSEGLYDELQKIRTYKTTRLEVDPTGFDVTTTGEDTFTEVKIDLPDSWVRGFLQVSSAMTFPAFTFDLHPMDVHNLCFVLRRRKERKGPRSIRWHLVPGKPVRAVFDPWELAVDCPRSVYAGPLEAEIRIWGRRRLLILERLIPVARKFTVHLLGKGLPSFWVADLGDLSFTLGLSGWTANDWAASAAFDLLAPRKDVDQGTRQRVFDELKRTWSATPDALARSLGLDRSVVLSALGAWTQAGRVVYDLAKRVYRARELSREPLPLERLRFASEREAQAMEYVASGAAKLGRASSTAERGTTLEGTVKEKNQKHAPWLELDADDRIAAATCTCNFHQQNQLRKGPCEHLLALRLVFARRPT